MDRDGPVCLGRITARPAPRRRAFWISTLAAPAAFDPEFGLENMGLGSPRQRLVESPLFQPKDGASPVQVADVCAFLIRRRLEGCAIAVPIAEHFTPQLVSGWKTNFVQWAHVPINGA